jgi:drug/metabolite transporter (DMT)-like permease
MLNPVVIVITLGIFFWLRQFPYMLRLIAALGAVAVAGLALYSFDHYLTNDEKVRGLMFGLLAAVVWFAIAAGVDIVRKRQG